MEAVSASAARLTPTVEQAQSILRSHLHRDVHVASIEHLLVHGFSTFTGTSSFVVATHGADGPVDSDGEQKFILRVSPATSEVSPPSPTATDAYVYAPNSLTIEHNLLTLLPPSIPHVTPLKLDTSLALVPFTYLLLSHPGGVPLAQIKQSGNMSDRQRTMLDLRLGAYFKSLHDGVQNDWFGLPSQAKDELYSWQEAFVYLLEDLLREAKESGVDVRIPFDEVRRYLSRAIGSFLFDDVEVPSLVSFTGGDNSIFVTLPSNQEDEVEVTSLLSLSHALWGDPLLETVFMTDGDHAPSEAFLEGYGGSPIVFTRQRTKRTWYTFFLALMIVVMKARRLKLHGHDAPTAGLDEEDEQGEVLWAKETLGKCIDKLKDSPCY